MSEATDSLTSRSLQRPKEIIEFVLTEPLAPWGSETDLGVMAEDPGLPAHL